METIVNRQAVPERPGTLAIQLASRGAMPGQELAAECVAWYAYTGRPWPGMDWLKTTYD